MLIINLTLKIAFSRTNSIKIIVYFPQGQQIEIINKRSNNYETIGWINNYKAFITGRKIKK